MFKNKKVVIIISVVAVLFIVAIFLRMKSTNAEASRRPAPTTNVVLGKVGHGDIAHVETITGDVTSEQEANIYSKVTGNIEKIYVNIGDFVRQGQVLAEIDKTIYAQNVRQAQAAFNQASVNADNSKLNFERNQALFQQNLIARQDVDNAQAAYNVALAQKESAHAALSNAQTQLSYCSVRAPFSGTITKRNFDPGAYVSPTAGATGATLFTESDLDRLKADVNLPENQVQLLPKIQDIVITADALPNSSFKGVINKTSGAVDVATRTMAVQIGIRNPGRVLKPGMFVNINLIMDKVPNAMLLGNDVVLNDPQGNYVFVAYPDSTVHRKNIQTGIQQNNKIEVISGLDENDRIVFTGQSLVKNGQKVRILR